MLGREGTEQTGKSLRVTVAYNRGIEARGPVMSVVIVSAHRDQFAVLNLPPEAIEQFPGRSRVAEVAGGELWMAMAVGQIVF